MNDTEMIDWLEKNAKRVERETVVCEQREGPPVRKDYFVIEHGRERFTAKIKLRLAIETAAGEAKP